jgi:hypothetical protein
MPWTRWARDRGYFRAVTLVALPRSHGGGVACGVKQSWRLLAALATRNHRLRAVSNASMPAKVAGFRPAVLLAVAFAIVAVPRHASAAGDCVDEEATRHRDLAMAAGGSVAGLDAAKSYLERLNVLGSKDSRPACFDAMATDVPALRELYCAHDSKLRDAEGCVLLEKVQVDLLRLAAQKLVERADRTGGDDARALYEKGAETYADTYRRFCDEPAKSGRPVHAAGNNCEEIGYNAARAFTAARLLPKALSAFRLIIAADERTSRGSHLAARAMYEVGGAYQAMAVYDQAADWFERYARRHAKSPDADRALADACILRLGLGQVPQATKDAAEFAKIFGSKRRAQSAQLALAIALHHAERGEKEAARGVVAGAMESLDRGPLDLAIRGHALAAQVALTAPIANAEWAKVRASWSDPERAQASIRSAWPDEDDAQRDRRLGRALMAVGEAHFAAAEEKRVASVMPLKLPPYAGRAGDRAALLLYVQTTVQDWFVKKKAAIELVEPAYIKVLALQPVPPPGAVIGSAAAVASMWGELVDDLARVPVLEAWRKNPALNKPYLDAIAALSEPTRARMAKPAMTKCIELAVKYQFSDDRSRACATWLESHYKAEHYLVDELPPPLRETSLTTAPSAPLQAPSLE